MYPKKKELPDMKVDLPDFAGALEAIAINKQHDLFSAEIRERVLSIKTWIRCMPELHDYQDGKISKGLLCERIQEQVAIYILKGLEGEV